MTSFDFEWTKTDDKTTQLNLKGYLDENAQLPNVDELNEVDKLYINFGKLDFINSSGIKSWVNFSSQLDTLTQLQVYYVNCPKFVIDQVNLIEGFLSKNSKIESLLIPYFCEKCERSIDVFKSVSDLPENIEEIELRKNDVNCDQYPKCLSDIELDVLPAQYLRFLKNQDK